MIRKTTRTFSLLTAAAVLMTAGVVWAQPQGSGGRFGPHGPGAEPGYGLLYGPLGDRLDLSDEQRASIRAILESHRETAGPWHQDLRNLSGELEAEVIAENIASIMKIGTPVMDYDGKVYCFIEAGHDHATYAMFNYENPPDLKAANKSMHWFKMSYNKMYWTSVRGLL